MLTNGRNPTRFMSVHNHFGSSLFQFIMNNETSKGAACGLAMAQEKLAATKAAIEQTEAETSATKERSRKLLEDIKQAAAEDRERAERAWEQAVYFENVAKASEAFKKKMISIWLRHEIPPKLPRPPKDPPPGEKEKVEATARQHTNQRLSDQAKEINDFLIKRKRSRSR